MVTVQLLAVQGVGHGLTMISEGRGFAATQVERGREGAEECGKQMQDVRKVEQLPTSHHLRSLSPSPMLRMGRRAGTTVFIALAAWRTHAWRVKGWGHCYCSREEQATSPHNNVFCDTNCQRNGSGSSSSMTTTATTTTVTMTTKSTNRGRTKEDLKDGDARGRGGGRRRLRCPPGREEEE